MALYIRDEPLLDRTDGLSAYLWRWSSNAVALSCHTCWCSQWVVASLVLMMRTTTACHQNMPESIPSPNARSWSVVRHVGGWSGGWHGQRLQIGYHATALAAPKLLMTRVFNPVRVSRHGSANPYMAQHRQQPGMRRSTEVTVAVGAERDAVCPAPTSCGLSARRSARHPAPVRR